jgi:hypothetical protein
MNKVPRLAGIVALVFLITATIPARAQINTPVGYWRMTFYIDNAPNLTTMATQHICFYPNGTWKGTFPAWRGYWFQKGLNPLGNGDRVRVLGNYAGGLGNDSAELDFINLELPGGLVIPRKLMTGAWTQWRDVPSNFTSSYFFWGKVSLTFERERCPELREQAIPREQDERRNPAEGDRKVGLDRKAGASARNR